MDGAGLSASAVVAAPHPTRRAVKVTKSHAGIMTKRKGEVHALERGAMRGGTRAREIPGRKTLQRWSLT